jgi:hypothetical protein
MSEWRVYLLGNERVQVFVVTAWDAGLCMVTDGAVVSGAVLQLVCVWWLMVLRCCIQVVCL